MTIKIEVKEKVVELYSNFPNMTQREIGLETGIGRDTVLKILLEYGITPRPYTGDRSMVRRIRNFDFEFFDRRNISVAYWAGFLMADGHINVGNTGGATLVCYVKGSDTDHIQQFYDDINYQEPLKFRKEGYVGFDLHYSKFPEQLRPWGIIPLKTKNFIAPTCVTDKLLPHYLRGWIDGDGSVYRYGQSARISIASGNKPSMDWFASALISLGYDGYVGVRKATKDADNWLLYIGGRLQVEKVAKILLVDTEFCLSRKWEDSFYENRGQMFGHICQRCGETFLVTKYRHEKELNYGKTCGDCWFGKNK